VKVHLDRAMNDVTKGNLPPALRLGHLHCFLYLQNIPI